MAKLLVAHVGSALLLGTLFTGFASALDPEDAALFMRIVDTGGALCCVIKTDNGAAIVYDTGHGNATGFRAWKGVNDLFPSGHEIALMVLSHSDSDHLGGAPRIFDDYQVNEVVHSGVVRDTNTSTNTLQRISSEPDCLDIDLGVSELPEGTWPYGETKVTFLCGWHLPPPGFPRLAAPE